MKQEEGAVTRRDLEDGRDRVLALEQRLARVTEQASVWRERAEDRQSQLDSRLLFIRRLIRRVRQRVVDAEHPRGLNQPIAASTVYPQIRVAHLVESAGAELVLSAARAERIVDGHVPSADMIVIELLAFNRLSHPHQEKLIESLRETGVARVVVLSDGAESSSKLRKFMQASSKIGPFDPSVDPLAVDERVDSRGSAEQVIQTRNAYRTTAPERYLELWLDTCGVAYESSHAHVSCLLVTMRPEELSEAAARFDRQSWERRSLIIGCHGFDDDEWRMALERHGNRDDVMMFRFHREVTLGECLNRVASVATGDVLAKWDDDDHYGPGYLEDAVNALRYSGCDIIVKATQFTYIEEQDVTILRRQGAEETKFAGDASGGTYVFRRRVWEDAPFAHRDRAIDIKFLASARAVGYEVYSNSRFDFAYTKRASGSTWGVSTELIAAQGDVVFEGPPGSRVDA